MKNKFTLLLLAGGLFATTAFMPSPKNKGSKFPAWLKGAWQNKMTQGISMEVWEQTDDSTLTGKSYFIKGNDTFLSETISLEQRNNILYYIPTVKNQNSGQPVSFRQTTVTATRLVFENPAHDFPQKISYTLIRKDSIVAEISGMVKGQVKARQFPMKKL